MNAVKRKIKILDLLKTAVVRRTMCDRRTKDGYPAIGRQFFSNNRLIGLHGGAEFLINNWYCRCLLSYSLNYGTYTTSPGERGLGSDIYYYDPPYFPKLTQFSAFFETHRKLQNGFELGIQLAVDEGKLLNNSVGGGLTLTKRW